MTPPRPPQPVLELITPSVFSIKVPHQGFPLNKNGGGPPSVALGLLENYAIFSNKVEGILPVHMVFFIIKEVVISSQPDGL